MSLDILVTALVSDSSRHTTTRSLVWKANPTLLNVQKQQPTQIRRKMYKLIVWRRGKWKQPPHVYLSCLVTLFIHTHTKAPPCTIHLEDYKNLPERATLS